MATEIDAGVSAKVCAPPALQRALGALKAGQAEAMAYKRQQREYTGGEPPYGWRLAADGVHLDPHTDEQAIVREALELSAERASPCVKSAPPSPLVGSCPAKAKPGIPRPCAISCRLR